MSHKCLYCPGQVSDSLNIGHWTCFAISSGRPSDHYHPKHYPCDSCNKISLSDHNEDCPRTTGAHARAKTATGEALKEEDQVEASDFETEDWWKFLPPSLQDEALVSINLKKPEKAPAGEKKDEDHVCVVDDIDCCEAFRHARDEECTELAQYVRDNADHDDCHDDCISSDTYDELKTKIKDFIDEQ